MKTLIAYYSRTKVTRKIIEELQSRIDCDIEEITTPVKYEGKLGYVRGGKDGLSGKIIPLNPTKYNPSEYDVVILAGPVWAGKIANPVISYVDANKNELPEIKLIITAKGSGFESSKEQLETCAGKKALKVLNLTQKEVGKKTYLEQLDEFLA